MWQRTIEMMLACWLAMSPFIFRHPPENETWWWHDWIASLLIFVLAGAAFIPQTRFSHFGEIGVALWLMGFGWVTGAEGLHVVAAQNWMIVGLLLMMTAILPTDATGTPRNWQAWYAEHQISPPDV